MRGEKVSTPLTKLEEALGPDNTCMAKALPPASWHLTAAFVEYRLVDAVVRVTNRDSSIAIYVYTHYHV